MSSQFNICTGYQLNSPLDCCVDDFNIYLSEENSSKVTPHHFSATAATATSSEEADVETLQEILHELSAPPSVENSERNSRPALQFSTSLPSATSNNDCSFRDLLNKSSSPFPSGSGEQKEDHRFSPYANNNSKTSNCNKLDVLDEEKKENNRISAIKYRAKKREAIKVKSSKLTDLEKQNGTLKKKVEDLRSEIDYLKTLLLDVVMKEKTSVK